MVLLAGIRSLGASAGASHSLSGAQSSEEVCGSAGGFSPSVCSMLELQPAVLLGKFLCSLPPQLDETVFHSFFSLLLSPIS